MTDAEADALAPWGEMDGHAAWLFVDQHSNSYEDTQEMMNAWLRAKIKRHDAAKSPQEAK